jgi:hypothetical protein
MRRLLAVVVVPLLAPLLSAQNGGALNPPPPQTARQALIEMFFGTAANHLEKHLPDVTRKTFKRMDSGNGRSFLQDFSTFAEQAKAGGAALQTFDTGPTLLTAEGPGGEVEKVEITVERDDLIGDEDQLELALHMTRGGKEETLPFIPRFTFAMKMDADVWRLNEISVTVRLPLDDPDFLKNIEGRQRSQSEQATIWAIREVTTAEKGYQSANGSFACSLAVLGSTKGPQGEGGVFLFDRELATGKKGGYIFAISGCDESQYKIVAEPAAPDSGQRAFCSDESGRIRAADDGKATSCLSSGEPVMVNAEGSIPTASNSPNVEASKPEVKRLRVSEGVSQALVTTRVKPVFPGDANKIQGQVVLAATISTTGDVLKLHVISGPPALTPAAINAAKQWKYRPYLLNGDPVEVETQITIKFPPTDR